MTSGGMTPGTPGTCAATTGPAATPGPAATGPANPVRVLQAFTGLRRSLVLYPPGHRIIDRSLRELRRALGEADANGAGVRIQLIADVAHLEGYPFRADSRAQARAVEDWTSNGLECIEFESDVTDEELLGTARAVNAFEGGRAGPSIVRALEDAGVERVRLARLARVEGGLETFEWPDAPERTGARSYAETLSLARETVGAVFEGQRLEAAGVEALLEKISGQLIDDGVAMSEILAVKEYENYTFCHSVNVAALSLMLGRRVGLDREALGVIGEAALLHDIGKRKIPLEILRKPGRLTRRERWIIERHTVFGAEMLACAPGLRAFTPLIALEHHRHVTGGGYPDLEGRIPHPLSQVVAVVDIYEALTGARPYREPMVPEEVCLLLARLAGSQLNPALVRAFVGLISFFPIGSVVRTFRDEIGVVVRISEREPLHPVVELLEPETLERTGERIDTAERDDSGRYVRHIRETLRHAPVPAGEMITLG